MVTTSAGAKARDDFHARIDWVEGLIVMATLLAVLVYCVSAGCGLLLVLPLILYMLLVVLTLSTLLHSAVVHSKYRSCLHLMLTQSHPGWSGV